MHANSTDPAHDHNPNWAPSTAISTGFKIATGNLGLVFSTALKLFVPAAIAGGIASLINLGLITYTNQMREFDQMLPAGFVGIVVAAMLAGAMISAVLQMWGYAAASSGVLAHVEKHAAPQSLGNALKKRTPRLSVIVAAGALPMFLITLPQTILQAMQFIGGFGGGFGGGPQEMIAISIAVVVVTVIGGMIYQVRMAFWPFVATDQRSLSGAGVWKRTLELTRASWGRILGLIVLVQLAILVPIGLLVGAVMLVQQGFGGAPEPAIWIGVGAMAIVVVVVVVFAQTAMLAAFAWAYLQQIGSPRVYARLGLDQPAPDAPALIDVPW